MNEERFKILQMLSDGKISAEEAAELMDAASGPVQNAATVAFRQESSLQNISSQEDIVETETMGEDIAVANMPPRPMTTVKRFGFRGRWRNWANNVEGMKCDGANLEGAFFCANNLDSANFINTDAESSTICASNIDQAIFEGANLRGARILCSNLDGANFRNANLEGVFIFASNFDSANMEGADLRGQNFVCTNMDSFNVSSQPVIHAATDNL